MLNDWNSYQLFCARKKFATRSPCYVLGVSVRERSFGGRAYQILANLSKQLNKLSVRLDFASQNFGENLGGTIRIFLKHQKGLPLPKL